MKCEFCAGNISIEDVRCPHCDAENPYYKAHRADMDTFKRQFNETQKNVVENSKRFNRKTLNITVISILVALIAIAFLILINMDQINYKREQDYNNRHASETAAIIGKYEDAHDYLKIAEYYRNHPVYLYKNNPMTEYREVIDVAQNYAYIHSQIMQMIFSNGRNRVASDYSSYIGRQLDMMYDDRYGTRYERDKDEPYYSEKHLASIDEMIDQTELLFRVYLGFTKEETDELKSMTSAKRSVLLEEKFAEVLANEEE